MTDLSQENRRELEKFYTKPAVAIECINDLYNFMENTCIPKLNPANIHYLEPSAGAGVFVKLLRGTYNAYDIEPESPIVLKENFLTLNTDNIFDKKKDLVVIGNPPYKLALQFINKCSKINPSPKLIAFILPNVFKKPTVFNKIDKYYHIVYHKSLPKQSFELGVEMYDVPSGFIILEKKSIARELVNIKIKPIGFNFVPFKSITITDNIIIGADISVIRVGGRAGTAFISTDTSENANVSKQKYNYFIKFINQKNVNINIVEIINKINQVEWNINNTTGPKSIGKYELIPKLNTIYENL